MRCNNMSIIQYTFALLMAFTLVFAGQAAAAPGKHSSEKTRSRILKEISEHTSHKTKCLTVKDAK
jgi:hypothetical protein